MKRFFLFSSLLFLMVSFEAHKFYVSIYQIDYASEKKMLQITSRIFVDDLNKVLSEKYNSKVFLGEKEESQKDIDLLKKYMAEKFKIKVNGKYKTINFANKEMEGNVLICYYNSKDVAKIKVLEIENTALLELNDEQQNIIHTNYNGVRKSMLFSGSNVKGMLKY
nr:DUF6702 family protein [Flavobacterium sp. H122]